ncbi:16S RNA G1207 methylase RsmC [Levilactobacillus namurensis]|nr:class I SAM-dependent methyltransferase [Levilactobacillus namurensis]PTM22238.1 class I SAM-dependent methyltransferase [Lactobacillus sp. PFC-70]MCW3778602.1 class I SAM-dependent methyltransferase [Levilactobacillus namurensis]MDT7015081.1 class I SAM-dependent methyltransferase [Levilactobacillus namurensis]MDT7017971.1 class I SAM-dependent methyltransferase [Levilactobacillus namurensis]WNN65032.1 class I SAM-dependent methyltransferase [Levilactobacillus namurensis]
MTNHYYTQNPDVVHEERHWPFTLLGNELLFTTDNGVFSKSRVDYGSCALLNAFEADQTPAGPWLDLGCGYGPIGLALAKRWPDRQVTMADVNELALSLAQQNATANQITNVTIVESDRYAALGTQRYAAILTNPPVRAGKAVVTSMLTEAAQHLLPGGTLTVVLQKKQGAPSAKKTMTATFGNCQILKKDKGYYILESRQNASS